MPHPYQVDDAVLVHLGPHAVHFPAEHALGEHEVQMGQNSQILGDQIAAVRHLLGEGGQDAVDLIPLLHVPFF